MTENFESWTAYDDWLVQNYEKYAIYKLDDNGGKISIEYCDKADWPKVKAQLMPESK